MFTSPAPDTEKPEKSLVEMPFDLNPFVPFRLDSSIVPGSAASSFSTGSHPPAPCAHSAPAHSRAGAACAPGGRSGCASHAVATNAPSGRTDSPPRARRNRRALRTCASSIASAATR